MLHTLFPFRLRGHTSASIEAAPYKRKRVADVKQGGAPVLRESGGKQRFIPSASFFAPKFDGPFQRNGAESRGFLENTKYASGA